MQVTTTVQWSANYISPRSMSEVHPHD